MSELISQIKDFFGREGVEAYLVGGFVRNLLLGRKAEDIDLAVKGEVIELANKLALTLGGKCFLLDRNRGISRIVLLGGVSIDISPLKSNIEIDLSSRDFTIDALAIKVESDEIIDPFGGREDLKERIIRAVKEDVFKEDPARLLRAVRLATELGFVIEERTRGLIKEDAHLITEVAGERKREELLRLLSLPHSYLSLKLLHNLGLLFAIIPELKEGEGVSQPPEHYWDVFTHSLETVRAVEFLLREGDGWGEEVLELVPWSPFLSEYFSQDISGFPRKALLKFSALLHDVAKPKTKIMIGERARFFGHSKEGVEIALKIMERLRFSNKEKDMVAKMIVYHLRPTQMGEIPTKRAIYRFFRDTGDEGIDILFLSLADHLATKGPQLNLELWQEHTNIVNYILKEHLRQITEIKPVKLIDGHDIMNLFGLKPGPLIGELLEAVKEAQAAGEIKTKEEALALVRKKLGL